MVAQQPSGKTSSLRGAGTATERISASPAATRDMMKPAKARPMVTRCAMTLRSSRSRSISSSLQPRRKDAPCRRPIAAASFADASVTQRFGADEQSRNQANRSFIGVEVARHPAAAHPARADKAAWARTGFHSRRRRAAPPSRYRARAVHRRQGRRGILRPGRGQHRRAGADQTNRRVRRRAHGFGHRHDARRDQACVRPVRRSADRHDRAARRSRPRPTSCRRRRCKARRARRASSARPRACPPQDRCRAPRTSPTRNPVKLPGPVVTATRSICANSVSHWIITSEISGISASAWPRTIGRDWRARIAPCPVSSRAAEQASSAVSMARTRMNRVSPMIKAD